MRRLPIRTPALETIYCLIEIFTVHVTPEAITLKLEGALAALAGLAQGGTAKSPLGSGLYAGSVLLVAGAGFEPAAFRL